MLELVRYLKEHDNYAVMGHVNPDGDTAGSCIALAEALTKLGKRAFVYLPDTLPARYAGFDLPVPLVSGADDLPFEPQTAFSVDVAAFDRLGRGCEIFNACPYGAMIDHHPTNKCFGEVYYLDGEAASTGELAVKLIGLMGVELTVTMGTWLYIAISTDCGQFGYPSTRAETMEAAAICLRAGIDVGAITKKVFRTRSLARTRILGAVIGDMELRKGGKISVSRLTEEMYESFDAVHADSDGAVNYLLEVEGVLFACLAEQRGDEVKFSMRSNPPLEIAKNVAAPLGGGGHPNAAGATLKMSVEEGLEKVLALAEKAIDELDIKDKQ